jgi:hypothetical protein
LMVSCTF